jgi:hypothetical protein
MNYTTKQKRKPTPMDTRNKFLQLQVLIAERDTKPVVQLRKIV